MSLQSVLSLLNTNKMNKSEAIKVFGTAAAMARALGLSRGRISQWQDDLDQSQVDRVIGAAIRTGRAEKLPLSVRDSFI